MKNIELSEKEAQDLLVIIDIAVKTQGLQVASAALNLSNKIMEAFKDDN